MGEPDPFVGAIDWIVALLLGKVATSVAIIAVAGIGLAMLQGRLAHRDGLRVILGCAILFGAPAIARGFIDMAGTRDMPPAPAPHPAPVVLPKFHTAPPVSDPYAGAAVPQ